MFLRFGMPNVGVHPSWENLKKNESKKSRHECFRKLKTLKEQATTVHEALLLLTGGVMMDNQSGLKAFTESVVQWEIPIRHLSLSCVLKMKKDPGTLHRLRNSPLHHSQLEEPANELQSLQADSTPADSASWPQPPTDSNLILSFVSPQHRSAEEPTNQATGSKMYPRRSRRLPQLPLPSRWPAVPPTANLSESARDVFTKGYGFGLIKVDLKTKSDSALEFTSSGSANTETTKVTDSLETKYPGNRDGLMFTEKWDTDYTLGSEISVENQLVCGLKLTFDSSFSPNTGKKNAKIKTRYKGEHINLGCDVDFNIAGPSIRRALVLRYEGWLAGSQMNFETAKSRVTHSNFTIGYEMDDSQLHTNVNDGTELGGSIYQKVKKKLETAVSLAWTAGNSNTRFGIAAKYQIAPDACFSAKVNNSSLIGLGYTQTLKPGIKLILSALLDGKNVDAGGHKLGLGLEFQA
ncbi:LOW QUALITY PROTEIN: non-selective voltage-gated ion channel VDAC1-like [Erethizon dorsatum]